MDSKFKFYEVVKVISNDINLANINNKKGIIRGRSENDDGTLGYAVCIDEDEDWWHVNEQDLQSTGKFEKREKFYDGSSIRVSSKGEILSTNIVDPED